MNILLLEPYFVGSHAAWARGYAACSRHRVDILSLPGRHWKWRMHGGAVTLAQRFLEEERSADLLLASAMLDLTTFLALSRQRSAHLKSVLYFHENQLTYPWSPRDDDPAARRDVHYGFINYASALAADYVLFNSPYHRQVFLDELPRFLKSFPDDRGMDNIDVIRRKSRVLSLGLDLRRFDDFRPAIADSGSEPPLILWNHRWEYDKNPEDFFEALFALQDEGLDFRLAVLGESFREQPDIFTRARQKLGKHIVHFGFAHDFAEYAKWLWRSDILPVTAVHDFFGISVVEAMYCCCHPLLPKRLAYPGHVPAPCQGAFFYDDQTDLVGRLKELIRHPDRSQKEVPRNFVEAYDWAVQGPVYDALLSELATEESDTAAVNAFSCI
jgi:glycosyltransferase involved in cell wall biosynthesis